jgi:hypothetical protein
VNFSAAAVDGPSNVQIPVEARNPLGGPAGGQKAAVIVKNVAPQISAFKVTDSAGNEVNTAVPFVLTGMPITVSADFADPGVLDRQTATISWGDGSAESETSFDTFDEAFGDGSGSLSDKRAFNTPGTYSVELIVVDDDTDLDGKAMSLRVLTPAQAVGEIVAMIDLAISATTDPTVIAQLQHARLALTGSRPTSQNGALQMIQSGNNSAAIAFLGTSSLWLERSATGGANVATPLLLLNQIASALGG